MRLPEMTQASVPLTQEVEAIDEKGRRSLIHIPAERPLTVYSGVMPAKLGSSPLILPSNRVDLDLAFRVSPVSVRTPRCTVAR